MAACIMCLPVGYIFTTEPCGRTLTGAGGSSTAVPCLCCGVLIGAFIGGWLFAGCVGPVTRKHHSKIE